MGWSGRCCSDCTSGACGSGSSRSPTRSTSPPCTRSTAPSPARFARATPTRSRLRSGRTSSRSGRRSAGRSSNVRSTDLGDLQGGVAPLFPERMEPVAQVLARLARGETSSEALVRAALARIEDRSGEGAAAFTRVYGERALEEARRADGLRRRGQAGGPLAGLPVSVKDLFDVAGEPTLAGSVILRDAPPAERDAEVVTRLRAAGAIVVGKTNMTEFAFSGLGLNPVYGTPRSPWDRATGRIPGGSSSGAAVSVTDGMAAVALGTDTGGSVRIPAAFCGLVGFKPTARRVSPAGALPLSTTLDSVGPLAPSVACCALAGAVLSGEPTHPVPARPARGLRFAVPRRYAWTDVEGHVARALDRPPSPAPPPPRPPP